MNRTRMALLAAATVVLAGCTFTTSFGSSSGQGPGSSPGTGSQAGGAPAAGHLNWHSCASLAPRQRCATLQVPLDYSHPDGRKITLAISDIPPTVPASQQQGILLFNPGGPGASGIGQAGFSWPGYIEQGLDPKVAATYDIVGFDTRGVGSSVPALHCDPAFFARTRPDYIPASPAAEQALISRYKTYASDCQQRFGWLLPYLTTANIARDMDQIRAAMGQDKINYFSYSYGTYIGQVYATLFPQRVRRMVWDSTVDPTGVWYGDNVQQDYAFQGRMMAFFSWVAKYDNLYHLGSTADQVNQAWHAARAQLAARPVVQGSGPAIGAAEFDDTFLNGGYDSGYWPSLAAALQQYAHGGKTSGLVSAFNQNATTENEFAIYSAVECADVAWPRDWAKWHADAVRIFATAPFQAWDNTWFNAACAFWPVTGPARPMRVGAANLPPILMLQGTLDAATPYQGAINARRQFPSARMVVVTGGGNHGQSLAQPANSCVNNYLSSYLGTGALPQGTGLVSATCPRLPDPVPSG